MDVRPSEVWEIFYRPTESDPGEPECVTMVSSAEEALKRVMAENSEVTGVKGKTAEGRSLEWRIADGVPVLTAKIARLYSKSS